ncbi:hypothetical protein [Lichenihabitans psoromatis]|uniref:hypothetical protein n=1 Tax=Lichenihabitans psoromatis TaxID=2528642 RepID=UPI0010385209|nr:hypothetical protein [Lichenihabitans psoromatis]
MTPAITEALWVLLRYVVAALLFKLATYGWIHVGDIADLVGPITTIVSGAIGFVVMALYAVWRSRPWAKIRDVAAMPGVAAIVTTPAIATAQPSDKVVAAPPAAP